MPSVGVPLIGPKHLVTPGVGYGSLESVFSLSTYNKAKSLAQVSTSVVVDFEVVQIRDSVFAWNLFKFVQLSGVKPVPATSFLDGFL